MLQKIVNGIAIASGVVSITVIGLGGYVFIRKDAIIENIKTKITKAALGSVTGFLPSLLPDATGPDLPIPSAPVEVVPKL